LDREPIPQTARSGRFRRKNDPLGGARRPYGRVLMDRANHQAMNRDSFEALHRQGMVCAQRGQLEEAASLIGQAVDRDPGSADALNNLGTVVSRFGRYGEAVALYRRAIEIKPDFAAAHSNLGAALQGLGRLDAAIECYEAALALAPDQAKAHYHLGNLLQAQNRNEAAVASYTEALALEPGNAGGHNNLGSALAALGRLDEARHAFEAAIALAPRQTRYYWDLAACKGFAAGDAHLEAMEDLARDPSLGGDEQMPLHFALAKALADTEQHARAFRHLCRGNGLKRQRIVYDEVATLDSFERIRETFSAELMRAQRGAGHPSPVPVFILGMPRSGSSLVEQILARHPKVFGGGAPGAFASAMATPDGSGARPGLIGERLRGLGQRYLDRITDAAPARSRITDKMPANFRFAGLLHLALPNARIIHIRRNPVDTCVSCFAQLFTGDQPYSYELGELGRYYRAYERLMAHWRSVLPEGVMLEVDYEDLVTDVEGTSRRIVAHCGLAWDDSCLRFPTVYRSSVGRARGYDGMLGPLLEALGLEAAEDAEPARRFAGD
jgi:tetratricopeptide (TPR) repeat protein